MTKYKRTKTTIKEIIKYLQLRIKRIRASISVEKDERSKLAQEYRRGELDRLLGIIWNDKIVDEIKKMKKHEYTSPVWKDAIEQKNAGEENAPSV